MADGRWQMGRWKMEIPDFRFQNPCGERGVSFGPRMIISKN
jgi:hypothetical protein